jgi:hypothetical protein
VHDLRLAESGCCLTAAELSEQRRRAERLRPAMRELRRGPSRFEVVFGDGLDEPLLLELLAVERHCGPFFELDWSRGERTLSVGVGDPARRSALAALADAFAG